jgi:putative FmdB family regulatory protein
MPIYEYFCLDCKQKFEILRPMKDADVPISCEKCHSEHTSRMLTVFNAHSGGRAVAGASSASGCASCAGGSCASCGH